MNLSLKTAHIKEIPFTEPTVYFQKFTHKQYSSLLTGNGNEQTANYSIIGLLPHTIIKYENNFFSIKQEKNTREIYQPFWDFWKKILRKTNFEKFKFPAYLCGFIGYISYEALHKIENIPKKTRDNYKFPLLEFILYNRYIVFDRLLKTTFDIRFNFQQKSCINLTNKYPNFYQVDNLNKEANSQQYKAKIAKIKHYILEGDVYEVNLSQQINGNFSGNPFLLFKRLFHINPAPYSAYLDFNSRKIISNSPEMFLQVNNKSVETRPIKGTINRCKDKRKDELNKNKLLNSAKDQAELFMIVDLLRNDLGKVCKTGSVKVQKQKLLESYNNVHHLIGVITGTLTESNTIIDLIKAAFPGGSISGCPKIRSLEIIEEMETFSRNLYTGSIFILNKKLLISNIVIRSIIINNNELFTNTGGAITIDSNATDEYNEIIYKIKNIMEICNHDSFL